MCQHAHEGGCTHVLPPDPQSQPVPAGWDAVVGEQCPHCLVPGIHCSVPTCMATTQCTAERRRVAACPFQNLRQLLAWVRNEWQELALAFLNESPYRRKARFNRIADHFGDSDDYVETQCHGWRHVDDTWTCDNCGGRLHDDDDRNRVGHEDLCDSCYENYSTCECGCHTAHDDDDGWVWVDDCRYWLPEHRHELVRRNGEWVFASDEPESNEDLDCVPSYHSRPRSWNDTRPTGQVYGLELECWCNDALEVCRQLPDGYIGERDGSLDSVHGLEIIGPPLRLEDYATSAWKAIVGLPSRAWDEGTGYGIHISANRSSFRDEAHVDRFVHLIHHNQRFCERIAGRKETHWAKYGTPQQDDKYQAVNVQAKRLEVRIFRATLKLASLLKNVEFVACCQEFTAMCVNMAEVTLANFLVFVRAKQDRFPHLHAFLGLKNLYTRYGCQMPEGGAACA